jgi:hypothetical protein
MATATMTRPKAARRKKLKVELVIRIDGEDFDLLLYQDDLEDESVVEWVHWLRGEDGEWFTLMVRSFHPRRNLCTRCESGDCHHIAAIDQLGLF